MLSRVADSVHWMSRYVERAENVARFIDVNYSLLLGDENEAIGGQWAPLVYTTGDHEAFEKCYDETTRENVLRFLAFDKRNPNSILSCLGKARENARTIREIISSTMWEEINKYYLMVRASADHPRVLDQPFDFCNRVKLASHLHVGVTDSTMSHSEAWHFARMGRLIERADKTSRIVDVQYYILLPNPEDVGTALDVIRWSALLRSASALEMYRRVHGKITPERVADFLMLDRHFPRSLHFCVVKTQESLMAITGTPPGAFSNPTEQKVGMLRAELDYSSIGGIVREGLHEFVDEFQAKLNAVSSTIQEDFFTT
ncbi:hypothetical protein Pan216_53310 [Planctomycetes bacterium Pan216]|uniref:DUF403 domain-containing protein n=1 Tax=Kolteria novifilia TaxID=2527975 RepID=A0A518BBS9_9BACT|nr:hypothetical protein Pan216_53310 [Planctomycetes bacterium Pan216]